MQLGLEEKWDHIRAEVVWEYLLSHDYFEKKEEYVGSFVKLGFFLACSYLESRGPCETFDYLVYSAKATISAKSMDWCKYEPGALSPNSYLSRSLVDNLANLSGP